MKKQYLFLILVIYLIGCIMNLCYYIVIYGTFFSMHCRYLQPIITQYFIDNKSEIWLLFLIAHSKR